MKILYIDDYGKLYIKGKTVYFINYQNKKRYFPIEQLETIIVTNKITFTSGSIKELLRRGIYVHFISQQSSYLGSLVPRDSIEGKIILKQVEKFNSDSRYDIAINIVNSILDNMNAFLRKYNLRVDAPKLVGLKNIDMIRGEEARRWVQFYRNISYILKYFSFQSRTYYPPKDEVNALISFINSLLYSSILSSIYKSKLSPAISFVHEPSSRSFSLSLDIADIFKPLITYPLIVKLINKKTIRKEHFEKYKEGIFLTKEGLDIVTKNFNDKIMTPFFCKKFKRNISFNTIFSYEIYKLKRYILDFEKEYMPFKMRQCM